MGTQVPLTVTSLASTADLVAELPARALSDYFAALDIDIGFSFGGTLSEDPTDHPDETEAFCKSVAPRPRGALPWPGALLVGDMSVDGPGTNGILLDLDLRGACAVFTKSFGFRRGDAEDRFEIYAHEIGHMLNLSHAEAADNFPTAMHQWDVRSAVRDRGEIWRRAIETGSRLQRTSLSAFFGQGTRRPVGLPMSASCCTWLAGQASTDILPWGNRFKDPSGNGADDSSYGKVRCDLELQSDSGSVAQPVDLQILVTVKAGEGAVDLPYALDLRSGLIELHVTSPRSAGRRYRTKSRTCGTARRTLEEGKVLRRNYTLLGDGNGLLFPTAGTYTLEAVLPSLGARSRPVEFRVGPAVGPFSHAPFRRFLARDLPATDASGWRAVDEAVSSPAVSPVTKAFLGSKAFARDRGPAAQQASREGAAPRVREREALLRVVRLRREPAREVGALNRAIDEAEQILRFTDDGNPSLLYLEHVRENEAQRQKEMR